MIIKKFEFNNFPVNTYLLYDETAEAVLIDCGCMYPQEEEEFSRFVADHKLNLKRLLCTHLHLDHVLGNGFINEKYGLLPEAHPGDVDGLPTLEQQAGLFGISLKHPPVPVTHFLQEGGTVRFGNTQLDILYVPGHSPGSIVFHNPKDKIAISGDVLFYGSIGRTDLWNGDQTLLVQGIRDKLLTLPPNTVIYPGHGPETTIGFERLHNPFIS